MAPLLPGSASLLGLRAGLPVIMAPYDIACMALGCGAVAAGQASAVLGTTICTQVMRDDPDLAGAPCGINIPVFGRILRSFPSLTGCELLEWTAALLGLASVDALGDLAASVPPGADGLAMLPYFSPAGERAPFFDTSARGSVHGLSFHHGRAHIARAAFEAAAFVVDESLRAAGCDTAEIRVCGGGARSDLWCSIIADMTGREVWRSADPEVGARGALIAARHVLDGVSLERAAARLVACERRFLPDPANHDAYRALTTRMVEARTAWCRDARS